MIELNGKKIRLVVISDFGRNTAGILGLVYGTKYIDAVIATCKSPMHSARLAKSMLRDLHYPKVPVYVGSSPRSSGTFKAQATYSSLAKVESVGRFSSPLKEILDDGFPTIIVVNSPMTDLRNFLRDDYNPNQHKIGRIVMQGAAERGGYFTLPDRNSVNNISDITAAFEAFTLVQRFKIPFTIVTEALADKLSISLGHYSDLGTHKILNYLEQMRVASLGFSKSQGTLTSDVSNILTIMVAVIPQDFYYRRIGSQTSLCYEVSRKEGVRYQANILRTLQKNLG